MSTVPDPSTIDFAGIAAWGAGIALVAGSVVATLRSALKSAARIGANLPPTEHRTDVYTTDSVAMHELATTIEAVNITIKELHALLKAEIDARTFEEKVEDEVERRLAEKRGTRGG